MAAFDGENADPINGHFLGDGIRAYTPWGELAYALGGVQGYEILRKSDEQKTAPGADTLRELINSKPALFLLDELSIYLRKQGARDAAQAARQLTAFLTALFKAVETSPRTALVYTLAIGKRDGKAIDAYSSENQTIADMMQEAESATNSFIEQAHQKQQQSEELDKAISEKRSKLNKEKGSELLSAAVGWATGKSKALKGEIEDLRDEISTHEETIERLQGKIQTMQSDHQRELMKLDGKHQAELNRKEAEHTQETTRLKNRIAWQNHLIGCLSFLLLKTSDIFRKAVNGIIRLAKDYYKPRFDTEQVSDIKDALNLFGDDRQSHRAAGDFLYLTAKQKGDLDSREQIKAKREVDNVVDGHYDYQQKRGFSIRR